MRLGGDALSDPHHLLAPADSTSDRNTIRHPKVRDVSVEGSTPLARKGYTYWAASSSSTRIEAQTGVRQPAKRPYLRRIGRRLPVRTFPPPAQPRKSKILPPSPAHLPAEYDATSLIASPLKSKTTPPGPPLGYQFQNGGAYRNNGEEIEGDESNEDEDEEESSGEDDEDESADEGYEDESEGGEISAPHIQPRPPPSYGTTTQTHLRAARSQAHQSSTLLLKMNGHPQAHRALQGYQNGSPLVRRDLPAQPTLPRPNKPPVPEALTTRPASFTTSRARPQRILEGPNRTTWPGNSAHSSMTFNSTNKGTTHYPGLSRSSGDVPGASTEWDERSEAGVRSFYSQHSNPSVARSIYLEQQVARREDEAAWREEEARRKEEDARGLEMAARKAFAWVQSLEARAGRIHDVAMRAEAKARHRDAEIWERQAEVLRRQAETAKREVEVTKREIAVERAEQEARSKAREARRKEAELLLKEEEVRRKEEEALRIEEDTRRMKLEVRWREEQFLNREKGRRALEHWASKKEVVVSAWEKLKERIGRDIQVNKQNTAARILQDKDEFNGNGIGIGSNSFAANTDLESSTRALVQIPRSVNQKEVQEQNRDEMIRVTPGMAITVEDQEELRSGSRMVTSECGTSAEVSAEYTVRSVNSYKERLHRSPAGYFRHVPL